MTATYGCWQVSPKPLPFFLFDLFRRLSLTALVFDDCMENDTWVMWDRHRTGESKGGFDLRNPKPETRNPKRTAKVSFNRPNPKPETRNPKPKVGFRRRNPKPETDSESWFQATKPETRNPKPTAKVGFKRRNPKPETRNRQQKCSAVGFNRRNPKPETRNRQRKLVSIDETRNPKPETDSESWFQSTKPETRNRQRKLVSIDETRNPKPETRNRLESDFWVALRIGTLWERLPKTTITTYHSLMTRLTLTHGYFSCCSDLRIGSWTEIRSECVGQRVRVSSVSELRKTTDAAWFQAGCARALVKSSRTIEIQHVCMMSLQLHII